MNAESEDCVEKSSWQLSGLTAPFPSSTLNVYALTLYFGSGDGGIEKNRLAIIIDRCIFCDLISPRSN